MSAAKVEPSGGGEGRGTGWKVLADGSRPRRYEQGTRPECLGSTTKDFCHARPEQQY